MRNRAICKLCESLIESKHGDDFVACKCGEISVDGGPDNFICYARNWDNFERIDDMNKAVEFSIEKIGLQYKHKPSEPSKPTREEVLSTLKTTIKEILNTLDRLPPGALLTPVTQYDYQSLLLMLSSVISLLDDSTDVR